jgi:hypothetical protein
MNPVDLPPVEKIKMIKASLRCQYFGLAAFLPFIGPILGILASLESGRARRFEIKSWNPARAQRLVGVNCAIVGTLLWTIADLLIVWNLLNPARDS